MSMLSLQNVTVMLGARKAVDGVEFESDGGALIALCGPNGAGKSTLLRAIAGLIGHKGSIRIDGVEIGAMSADARGKTIAYLPQGRTAHWPMTVARVVALGRLPHGAAGPSLAPEDAAAVSRALAATDCASLADRRIDQLSGGERARALLARALSAQAPILLADEPTEALDPAHRLQIMDALSHEARRGALVIAAMHDLPLAAQYAGRAILLNRGKLAASGAVDEVLSLTRVEQVYGVRPSPVAAGPFGSGWELAPRE